MKKLIVFSVLAVLLIGIVFAQGFLLTKEQKKEVEYKRLNITNDFVSKVIEISTAQLCIEDSKLKLTNKDCQRDKKVNLSDSNYFNKNSQGVIQFEN